MNRLCDNCDRLFNEDYINWIEFMNDYGDMKRYTLCVNCTEKLNESGKEFFNLLAELENKNKYKSFNEGAKDACYYGFIVLLWVLGLWIVMEICF